MTTIEEKQKEAIRYYDKLASVYDLVSSKWYYHKPRELAIKEMGLDKNQLILNLPCGTGQNFEYFQEYMVNTGRIIGVDLSKGMLQKAEDVIKKNNWSNVEIIKEDATQINAQWMSQTIGEGLKFDSILCDLGLSGFPQWELIIDNLISMLKPNGKLVIMDWYIEKLSFKGRFIKWVGKGEIDRPLWQYMENKVDNFKLDNSFKSGDMFVSSGNKSI